MKLTGFHIAALSSLLTLGWQANAQEAIPGQAEREIHTEAVENHENEKVMAPDEMPARTVNTTRETSTPPSPANVTAKKNTKTPESRESTAGDPLNFNFLYYLIEKFKSTDIIEQ